MDKKAFQNAVRNVFHFCDLRYWYGETYWRNVNGEESQNFPGLDYEDYTIINAFWSVFSILLLYAEKEGFGSFGLDRLDDRTGILGFMDDTVDGGFGRVIDTAWSNMCGRFGYFYPKGLNFSPRSSTDIIEDTPASESFSGLERALQISLLDQEYFYCGQAYEGKTLEEKLEAYGDDIEFTSLEGDFCVYCLVNRKLWELQQFIHGQGISLEPDSELGKRYLNLKSKVTEICSGSGWGDGDTISFEDGRTAEYSMEEYETDEAGYCYIVPPIVYNANVISIFEMEDVDRELDAVTLEIKALADRKEKAYEQKEESPCA